jgi:RHS repeat-associated protein
LATAVTDALGNQTSYRFNSNGALIGVTDALGQTRTIARDGGNYIVGLTGTGYCPECGDTGAGDQGFSYDDSTGNLLSHTDALGNTTIFTYDPIFNKLTSIMDALGDKTTFNYDSHGNLLTQKDPNGNVTSYQHDQYGQLTQATDPQNQSSYFSYDSFGNLVSIKDALGNITLLSYDGNGRLLRTQDPLGRTTVITYDKSNRITRQTNAQSGVTSFAYDQVGNLLSVTDARGNNTSFTYDLMDRLLTRSDPLGRTDTRTYDSDGNLIRLQDRRGQTSGFTYDAVNRLTGENYQDGSSVARSYDANSRLLNVSDSASGAFAFAYDLAGRLTSSATPFGAVNYVRDALGRATSRQVAGQPPIAYTYDLAGNLLSASTTAASVNRTYDSRNLVSTVNRMNGVASQYTYDQLGRLATLTHAGPSGSLSSQTYSYDATGNRTSATNSMAQSLVTQAVAPTLYDGDNEQIQFGSTGNIFDASGNLTTSGAAGGNAIYIWDTRGRLVSMSAPNGQTTSFTYDFTGNLLQQKDAGPAANVIQTFVLDDLTNVAYVNRSEGDQYSVLAGQWIDDHLAVVHSSGLIEYGLGDALNSIVATVDQTGTVQGHVFYDPFGQTTTKNSTYPFEYSGRMLITGGLYYYRARFYNPTSGRFISEDPMGFTGDFNLYSYVRNNPINRLDSLGLYASNQDALQLLINVADQLDQRETQTAIQKYLLNLVILAACPECEGVAGALQLGGFSLIGSSLQVLANGCIREFEKDLLETVGEFVIGGFSEPFSMSVEGFKFLYNYVSTVKALWPRR